MTAEFAHDTAAQKFTMHVDGELVAHLDYTQDDHSISITSTYSDPQHRGKGYAGDLVAWMADQVESNDTRRIVAVCPYVANWFARHGERGNLLTR